ncbi:MAG: HU family DNA-binding protein [Deltaproteobacteria bacterium]|nr:HU family DNA-binding protein [Deltaproteobacteria bacterium]
MNKSDLARIIAERRGIHQRKADSVVNIVFDSMAESLRRKERIEIRGFGSFVSKHYKAYVGRNPKTGEQIEVPAKSMPYFKVGKDLKHKINVSEAVPEAETGDEAEDLALPE